MCVCEWVWGVGVCANASNGHAYACTPVAPKHWDLFSCNAQVAPAVTIPASVDPPLTTKQEMEVCLQLLCICRLL